MDNEFDFDSEWEPKHNEMLGLLEGLDERTRHRSNRLPVVAGEVDVGEGEAEHRESRGVRAEFSSPLGAWKKMQESEWTRPEGAGGAEATEPEMGMGVGGIGIAPPKGESVAGGNENIPVMNEAANTLQRGAEKLYEVFSNHVTIAIVGAGG